MEIECILLAAGDARALRGNNLKEASTCDSACLNVRSPSKPLPRTLLHGANKSFLPFKSRQTRTLSTPNNLAAECPFAVGSLVLELNLARRSKSYRSHTPIEPGGLYSEVFLYYPSTIRNGLMPNTSLAAFYAVARLPLVVLERNFLIIHPSAANSGK